MTFCKHILLIFGLLIVGQAVNAFNVCRSQGICRPDSQCCGMDCMPLFRKDCDSCPAPPCSCRTGECISSSENDGLSSARALVEISDRAGSGDSSAENRNSDAIIWPDILLIVSFSVVVAFSLSSIVLWTYLTFRDTKRMQREDALRKEMGSKAAASRSQTSLRTIPARKVSSKSSKEVEKTQPQAGQ